MSLFDPAILYPTQTVQITVTLQGVIVLQVYHSDSGLHALTELGESDTKDLIEHLGMALQVRKWQRRKIELPA